MPGPLENPRITAPEIQCVHRAEDMEGNNNLSNHLEFFGIEFLNAEVLNKISIAIRSRFTVYLACSTLAYIVLIIYFLTCGISVIKYV